MVDRIETLNDSINDKLNEKPSLKFLKSSLYICEDKIDKFKDTIAKNWDKTV